MNYGIKIQSGGQNLDATLLVPEEEKEKYQAIIFYHGSGSDKEGYIKRSRDLVEKGYVCLAFSFRGCGKSEGSLKDQTINMALEDALAVFDFVSNDEKIDEERVGVCGRSFGGYLAALVSERRNIKSLVLSVPAIYKDEDMDKIYIELNDLEKKYFRENGDFSNTEALRAISEFEGDLYVLEHEKDTVVPQNVVKSYFEAAKKARSKEYTTMQDALHHITDPQIDSKFRRLITDWFIKTL